MDPPKTSNTEIVAKVKSAEPNALAPKAGNLVTCNRYLNASGHLEFGRPKLIISSQIMLRYWHWRTCTRN